jgi:hypothetical protein
VLPRPCLLFWFTLIKKLDQQDREQCCDDESKCSREATTCIYI